MWSRALVRRWGLGQVLQNIPCPCSEEAAMLRATSLLQQARQAVPSFSSKSVSSLSARILLAEGPGHISGDTKPGIPSPSSHSKFIACSAYDVSREARAAVNINPQAAQIDVSRSSHAGFKAYLELTRGGSKSTMGAVRKDQTTKSSASPEGHHHDQLSRLSKQQVQNMAFIPSTVSSSSQNEQVFSISSHLQSAFRCHGISEGDSRRSALRAGLGLDYFKMYMRQLSTSKGKVSPPSPGSQAKSRAQVLTERSQEEAAKKSQGMVMYLLALVIAMVGATYAAVPLYRLFCQATGFGGTVQRLETVEEKIARNSSRQGKDKASQREIVVTFNADVSDDMPWRFTPSQREVRVRPGQSTLAFYTAQNLSDKPITGISTYNVSPMRAGAYFNKIQCFCFEEQRLRPGEKIDMPVFFYIDPEFAKDRRMDGINMLTLSYTFFKIEDE